MTSCPSYQPPARTLQEVRRWDTYVLGGVCEAALPILPRRIQSLWGQLCAGCWTVPHALPDLRSSSQGPWWHGQRAEERGQ